MQAHTTGRCVFGSVALVLVHRQLVATEHAVFAVSRGPYKAAAGTAAPAPAHMPARSCVSWAPGVNFDAVEAWWQDLVQRPAVQAPAAVERAAAGPGLRFAGLRCPAASPRGLVAGVKLIRVRRRSARGRLLSGVRAVAPMAMPANTATLDCVSVQVALEQELASLKDTVLACGAEDADAALEAITDEQLLHDPVAARRSCDSDASMFG